jgi:hypothetical protein
VVDVSGVSYLRAEPIEQVIGAPLQGGRSHPQDLEVGTIESFSLLVSFHINLFLMLDSILQKKKYWGRTPLLGHLAACAR